MGPSAEAIHTGLLELALLPFALILLFWLVIFGVGLTSELVKSWVKFRIPLQIQIERYTARDRRTLESGRELVPIREEHTHAYLEAVERSNQETRERTILNAKAAILGIGLDTMLNDLLNRDRR
jgi:hypothetical protein